MSELSKAVSLSGAIDEGMLRELTKWRLPVEIPNDDLFDSPEEAIEAIEDALTGHDQVEVRATDLDVLKQFLRTKRKGKLHLEVSDTENGKRTAEIEFGVTRFGEYIIPWRADSVEEILTNGRSHIIDGRRKVYISNVQQLYFGDAKAFILCTPIKNRESHVKQAKQS